MNMPYPIVEQRALAPVPKRGPFGLGGRVRDPGDLPRPSAHQVLVYRVDGNLVEDSGRRSLDDEDVVNARHVSVVDLRRSVPVTVELKIESAEASEFTLRVQFHCTVTDAVQVVRDGLEAETTLQGYLRRHHRIFEIGLRHRLSAVNTVRHHVQSQIRAYTYKKPPNIPGMTVTSASIEVLTPEDLVALHRELRGQEHAHTVATGRAQHDQALRLTQAEHEHILNKTQVANEQELTETRTLNEQKILELQQDNQRLAAQLKLQEQRNAHELAQERRIFAQVETDEIAGTIGDDPLKAALYAYHQGELTMDQIAASIAEAQRHRLALQEAQRQEARSDRHRVEEMESAERRHQLEIQLSAIRELAERGHYDDINVDLGNMLARLVERTIEGRPSLADGAHDQAAPAVTAAPVQAVAQGRVPADDFNEASLEEEDGEDDGPQD